MTAVDLTPEEMRAVLGLHKHGTGIDKVSSIAHEPSVAKREGQATGGKGDGPDTAIGITQEAQIKRSLGAGEVAMDVVHFRGRVVPPEFNISVGYDPKITHNEPQLNFAATFRVIVKNSTVDIECELPRYDPAQFSLLYSRAYDRARAALNLVSFASGIPQTLILERFVLPDGSGSPIVFYDPSLSNLCTAFRVNTTPDDKSFDQMYNVVQSDFELFLALDDLISSLTSLHTTQINCGRVIDGIRRMIAPGLETAKGWRIMQSHLNISQPYQQWISDQSAKPRHADRSFVDGATVTEVIKRTWIVMNRFLEFRKRGNQPLTASEFPLLT